MQVFGNAGTRLICWPHVNRKLRPRLVNEPLIADEPMIPEVQVPVPLEVQSVPAKRTRHLLTRAFKRKKITELIE